MVFSTAQRTSLFVGAIAFMVVPPSMALAEMQSGNARPATVLAAQPAAGSIVEQLKLSNQQKQKIQMIRKERAQSISKALNETQRKKLVQSLRSGTKIGAAMQTLNLSTDQKKQISAIVRQSNQAIEATLTPTQKQQLAAYRKQHQATSQGPIE